MWKPLLLTLLWTAGAVAQSDSVPIFDESLALAELGSGFDDLDQRVAAQVDSARRRAEGEIDAALEIGETADQPTAEFDRGNAIFERSAQIIADETGGNGSSVEQNVPPAVLLRLQRDTSCIPRRPPPNCKDWCFHKKYRNIDGTCNNLQNPLWGSILTPFDRILPAFYENGFNLPRSWSSSVLYNGYPLPSPRLVSIEVVSANNVREDRRCTAMLMQWGQFLDHDLDSAPLSSHRSPYGSSETCDNTCINRLPCFPIPIPDNDPRVKTIECFGFTRSSAICGSGRFPIRREQVNEITSYIDASNVYGSEDHFNSDRLRDPNDRCLLRTGNLVPGTTDKFFLPFDSIGDFSACEHNLNKPNTVCFLAGDARSTEQPGLTAMHTLFMREHNRIASQLKIINPQWNEETVYQEAKKIVGAIAQVITYCEFLPKILGTVGMDKIGPYKGYNANLDASIANSFATAAYRFGHGLVNPFLEHLDSQYNALLGIVPLHEAFFEPDFILNQGGTDPFVRGLVNDNAKKVQPKKMMTEELTERLFALAHDIALDLAALNINRGRDHGLPTYEQMRRACGLGSAQSFDDLRNVIRKRRVRRALERLYGTHLNIDLFPGGLAENPIQGARVGPTFFCILTRQFQRLRDGDRFWYENPGVFNSDQLAQIRKASLARIICDNSENINEVQPDAMHLPRGRNERVSCDQIHGLDLTAWRDGGCPGYPEPFRRNGDFDPDIHLCCCDAVYNADPKIFKCCGDKLYDPRNDTCCDGELYCGRPEGIFSCCGKYIFNSASERCVDGLVCPAGETRVCGNLKYNSRTHICCAGRIWPKTSRQTTCCGAQAYIPKKQICCEGFVRKVLSPFTRCCHAFAYESNMEVCCPGTEPPFNPVHPRPRNLGDVVKRGFVTEKCSRNDDASTVLSTFNFQLESCCCGLRSKSPLSNEENCCGTRRYNIWNQLCCNGVIVEGDPKVHKCCGNDVYNPSMQSCCDTDRGLAVVDCVGGCPVPDTGDCDGKQYDVLAELCCNKQIFKRPSSSWQCCNGEPYDTNFVTCCSSSSCKPLLQDLNRQGGVCTIRNTLPF